MVKFSRPGKKEDGKGNGTFDFLGFTHYWGRSQKGNWVVKRKTAGIRLRRAGKRVWEWCSKEPTRINIRAAVEVEFEIERTLPVLRDPGKLRESARILRVCEASVAEVAWKPRRQKENDVRKILRAAKGTAAAGTQDHPPHLSQSAGQLSSALVRGVDAPVN